MLGFEMYEWKPFSGNGGKIGWTKKDIVPLKKTEMFENDVIIIHKSRVGELVGGV
jgi:hypothetical protein